MTINITFHYPPELMNLLIDAIPLLNRSKRDLFLFFKGAGVSENLMSEPYSQWKQNSESIKKYEITRQVLVKLNEKGEQCLRERREIIKRIVEFENLTVCWESDRLKAKGLIAEIRDLVNVKDSFTRMNIERESERKQRVEKEKTEREILRQRQENIDRVKNDLFKLFSVNDPHARGKALEDVLNRMFKAFDIGVREAFTLVGESGEGVLEQIDGVVEIDSHIYFTEMKWWDKSLGVPEISNHLVRVYHRAESRAIIISASDFTKPAISTCKEALQQKVVVLCTLKEIVGLIDRQGNLKELFKKKVQAAISDKNPFLLL